MQLFNVTLHQNSKFGSLRLGLTFQIENPLSWRRVWKIDLWNIYKNKILQDLCTNCWQTYHQRPKNLAWSRRFIPKLFDFSLFVNRISLKKNNKRKHESKQCINKVHQQTNSRFKHISLLNTLSSSVWRKKLAREANLFHSITWFTMQVNKQTIISHISLAQKHNKENFEKVQ